MKMRLLGNVHRSRRLGRRGKISNSNKKSTVSSKQTPANDGNEPEKDARMGTVVPSEEDVLAVEQKRDDSVKLSTAPAANVPIPVKDAEQGEGDIESYNTDIGPSDNVPNDETRDLDSTEPEIEELRTALAEVKDELAQTRKMYLAEKAQAQDKEKKLVKLATHFVGVSKELQERVPESEKQVKDMRKLKGEGVVSLKFQKLEKQSGSKLNVSQLSVDVADNFEKERRRSKNSQEMTFRVKFRVKVKPDKDDARVVEAEGVEKKSSQAPPLLKEPEGKEQEMKSVSPSGKMHKREPVHESVDEFYERLYRTETKSISMKRLCGTTVSADGSNDETTTPPSKEA